MLKNKLLLISVLTILFIAVFHYLSLKYSWYWTYRWLDIPMHIVGGFWVAITTLWICINIKHVDNIYGYKKKSLVIMLFSVLVIAILWEIFELIFNITSFKDTVYWQDTLSDIINGFVGAMISFLYFIKNKRSKNNKILESGGLSMIIEH